MTRANARVAACVIAALATTPNDALAAPTFAAILATNDDVRQALLIGPSGQFWEPDGAGTWLRRTEGGVAADVTGAIRVGGTVVVVGRATPLYRRDGDLWMSLRLGERGRTLVGTGVRAAVGIGKQVFVYSNRVWKRVATSERPFRAMWAGSDTSVFVGGPAGVARLVGKSFRAHAATPIQTFGTGAVPWAVTADGALLEVIPKRIHRPSAGADPVTAALVTAAGDDTVWVLGRAATGTVLLRRRSGAWTVVPPPPLADDDVVVDLAADRSERILIATQAGAIHLGAKDGTWIQGTVTEKPPLPRAGPGPARAR